MDDKDGRLGEQVLRTIADAYPQTVHFGYLGLALGVSGAAIWRALRQLKADGLIAVDRSLASGDIPFSQTRISAKGLAVAAGISEPAQSGDPSRRLEALRLSNLPQSRLGARSPAGKVASAHAGAAAQTQNAEQLLGTAAA
jgi:hypothetical protein